MADIVQLPKFIVNETPIRGSVSEDSLKGFYTAAKQLGFARDNLFRITNITNIKELQTGQNAINNFFKPGKLLYVKTGSIPSRKINTTKLNYKNFSFNIPIGASYPSSSNWALTFYSDDKYLIKDIFEYWSQQVYNEHGFKSYQGPHTDISFTLYRPSRLGADKIEKVGNKIRDKRPKTERIDLFNFEPVRDYKLYGCFPINLGDITYSTTAAGNIVSITTTLAYQYMSSNESTSLLRNTINATNQNQNSQITNAPFTA